MCQRRTHCCQLAFPPSLAQPALMHELVIRPATAADVPPITAIYAHAVVNGTASFELEPPSADEMLRRYSAITSGGFPFLAAESGRTVIGYAYANAYRLRPAYRFTVEDSIYVAPEAHGMGVGSKLLAALIERAEAGGYRQMIAVIGDSRQISSIAIHRSAGFVFSGTLHSVGFKFGRWLDSVLMQRSLGAGDTDPPADVPR